MGVIMSKLMSSVALIPVGTEQPAGIRELLNNLKADLDHRPPTLKVVQVSPQRPKSWDKLASEIREAERIRAKTERYLNDAEAQLRMAREQLHDATEKLEALKRDWTLASDALLRETFQHGA